ncbi:MAG: TlpA disulfide reductase family protein [Rhodothermales bacterium]|nr:TlpA disulfide reductase family protein [Rhodothermales bacterium]
MKTLLPLLLALLLLPACEPAGEDEPLGEAAPATPQEAAPAAPTAAADLGPAPAFTLPTLGGDSLSLRDYRGEVVLLNFWATWCTPCIAEMPDLTALHEELEPHGLTVVGISVNEEAALIQPFAERLNVTYPLALDDGSVAEAYGGVWALPTTYLIDADGQIVQRVIGLFPVEEMRPQLRTMLGLPPAATSSS